MQGNKWIKGSCAVYAALLNLYPQPYREHYAESMRQVFSDECRARYKEHGLWSLLGYWLRVLPDLGYTALVEHITTPGATLGLMEPVPGAPLPWKGVLLILLPGLVYLVSQIAQLIGTPWYLTVYYRGALILILPVLLVWAIKRRFPIWGLIPLGLLYRLIMEVGYQVIMIYGEAYSANPILNFIVTIEKTYETNGPFVNILLTIAIVFLAMRYLKRERPVRRFWLWLSVYILLIVSQFINTFYALYQYDVSGSFSFAAVKDILSTYMASFAWDFYHGLTLLLLVFLITLFTKRHGFYAILILVGYTLPTMLIGTTWNFEELRNPALAVTVTTVVILVYRLLLSLVVPVWVSRTPRQSGKRHAILYSLPLVLVIQTAAHFFQTIFYAQPFYLSFQWVTYILIDVCELCLAYFLVLVMVQEQYWTNGISFIQPQKLSPLTDTEETSVI